MEREEAIWFIQCGCVLSTDGMPFVNKAADLVGMVIIYVLKTPNPILELCRCGRLQSVALTLCVQSAHRGLS